MSHTHFHWTEVTDSEVSGLRPCASPVVDNVHFIKRISDGSSSLLSFIIERLPIYYHTLDDQ